MKISEVSTTCFAVRRGELGKHLDVYFHLPEFEEHIKRLGLSKYSLVTLEEVSTQITDGTHVTPTYVESGFQFISVKDVREFSISFENTKYISEKEHREFVKRCYPNAGDVLLTKVGTIGLAAVIPDNAPEFSIFVSVSLIKPNKEKIIPEYLCAILNNDIARIQFDRVVKGIGVPDLHLENIREILIPLPPLDAQKSLVAEMESARATRQSKLAEADNLLKGIDEFVLRELDIKLPKEENKQIFAIKSNVMGKARIDPNFHHPNFYKLIQALQNTKSERLGNIVEFSNETWNAKEEKNPTFRYIEISGINTQTGEVVADEIPVSEAPSRAKMIVKQGDILVSLTRPHRGAIALLNKEFEDCIASTGFAVLRKVTQKNILTEYLWAILHNPICLRQMLQRSSGGNYPAITDAELKQIFIPTPSLDIQKKIVAELETRRTQARLLHHQAESQWQRAKETFEKALLG